MTALFAGWRIHELDAHGRGVLLSPRLFTVKSAAAQYAELARASGHPSAYVAEAFTTEENDRATKPRR